MKFRLLLSALAIFSWWTAAAQAPADEPLRKTLEAALAQAPAFAQARPVQALSLDVQDGVVSLNFSRELLQAGGGAALDAALRNAAAALARAAGRDIELRIAVEGEPLASYRPAPGAHLAAHTRPEGPQATRIVLNPALGALPGSPDGVSAEGNLTAELAMTLQGMLAELGVEVPATRNLDKAAGGQWTAAALTNLREAGADQALLTQGATLADQDEAARALYANQLGAGMLLTLRAAQPEGAGAIIYYAPTEENRALAEAIRDALLAAAAQPGLEGLAARLVACAECSAESRLSAAPAVTIDFDESVAAPTARLAASAAIRDGAARMLAAGTIRAAGGGVMLSPTPGSTLAGSTVLFSWQPTADAIAYWLMMGNWQGGDSIFSQGLGTLTSFPVSGLPTDGRTVFVRLWTFSNGGWQSNDYTYRAYSAGGAVPAPAVIQSPASGSVLTGSSATFSWNAGVGASRYFLMVGAWKGGNTIYSQDMGEGRSASVTGLPTDGSPVWARLWSYLDGQWVSTDSSYTAAGGGSAEAPAVMLTPAPGSKLPGSTQVFTWSTGSRVTHYFLHVGLWEGGNTLFSGDMAMNRSATVSGLPADGRTIYVRLWSFIDNDWRFTDTTYIASGVQPVGVPATLLTPAPGSTLTEALVRFSWTAGVRVERYHLFVGYNAGNNDVYGGDQGTSTSVVVSLPTNGRMLFIRLWSYIDGAWQFADYYVKAMTR